jgi:hypothetical protein
LKLQQSTVNERGDGAFSIKLCWKNASINSNSHYCYCYCICKTLQVSRGGEPKKLKGKKEEKICAAKKILQEGKMKNETEELLQLQQHP